MPFLLGEQLKGTVWREVQLLCLIETTHFVELVIADFCLMILSSKALLIVGAVHKFDGVFKFHNAFLSFFVLIKSLAARFRLNACVILLD